MESVATVTALLVLVLNTLAGGLGAWRWWRVEPSDLFWVLARVGQAASVLLAVVAGVLYLAGARPENDLFWLYAVLPVAVSFFGEQFRILSAQTVLDARGIENAHAVGKLPEAEQRSVVLQIVRREIGVMALAALVAAFLAVRALAEVGGLTDDEPASAGGTVVVVGDSLANGTRSLLEEELDGWTVRTEARDGMPLAEGMDVLRRTPIPEGAVLAISLFTNNTPDDLPALEAAVRSTSTRRCVVWATITHPVHDHRATNDRLRALDRELPLVVVVPWAEQVAERPELLRPDGVHGTAEGYRVRAALFADAARSCA
jgi:hypothetical protein